MTTIGEKEFLDTKDKNLEALKQFCKDINIIYDDLKSKKVPFEIYKYHALMENYWMIVTYLSHIGEYLNKIEKYYKDPEEAKYQERKKREIRNRFISWQL